VRRSRASNWGLSLAGIVFVLGLWHVVTVYGLVSDVVAASPMETVSVYFEFTDLILSAFVSTTLTTLWGFGAALFLALVLGSVFALSDWIYETFMPFMVSVNSVPRVALAPLIIFYVGGEDTAKYVIAAWVAFFPMFLNVVEGLDATGTDEFNLFQSFGATGWQTYRKLRIPNSLPHVFDGLKIGISLAMVGAVVGEFVQGKKGIGALVIAAMGQLQMHVVFAAVGIISIAAVIVVLLVFVVQDRLIYWTDTELFT